MKAFTFTTACDTPKLWRWSRPELKHAGATAYVSLEPHAHHGRTPPCTNALIEAGIRRVVAPIEDPNPQVSGKGFAHLRSVGIEVCVGLMAREAERLNEKYLHFMRTGRPFVHLKLAVSLDGKIATRTGDSRWIAGPEARARAHELRHECDAILVGAGTVVIDDPLLTDRSQEAATPIIDSRRARRTFANVDWIATSAHRSGSPGHYCFQVHLQIQGREATLSTRWKLTAWKSFAMRPADVTLLRCSKNSVAAQFKVCWLKAAAVSPERSSMLGMVNKVTFFVAPVIIGGREAPTAVAGVGVEKMADALRLEEVEITQRGSDVEITGYPANKEG